jgi:YfiH family protein
MKMISTNLNKTIPLSNIGPQWAGVDVVITETGFRKGDTTPYSFGFNLGTHVGDVLANVQGRREALQAYLGAPIAWLNQVHGCDVFSVTNAIHPEVNPDPNFPNADASLSTRSDVALAIMTADCLPVLFVAFDVSGKAVGVAAAHAGWRGLHAGVLQACTNALAKACGVSAGQIKAWMGPAIGPESFEVGQEVFDAFVQQHALNTACFKSGQTRGKYLADIYTLARIALNGVGVTNVAGGGMDTLTDSRWFSHRWGQQKGVPSGRFATLIRLLPSQVA